MCFDPMCFARQRWLILPLRARKIRRHVVPTLRCWCRAFGWKEAATWDRPTVEIDLGVMFGLYDRMTASQRLQPVILWRCVTGLGQERPVAADESRLSTSKLRGAPLAARPLERSVRRFNLNESRFVHSGHRWHPGCECRCHHLARRSRRVCGYRFLLLAHR